jgi:hypothetical protein
MPSPWPTAPSQTIQNDSQESGEPDIVVEPLRLPDCYRCNHKEVDHGDRAVILCSGGIRKRCNCIGYRGKKVQEMP